MKPGLWEIYQDLYRKGWRPEAFCRDKERIAREYGIDESDLKYDDFILVCQAQDDWL